MIKSNEPFNKNISRLVKLTRDTDRPSEAFTEALTNAALEEMQTVQSGRSREGGSKPMKQRVTTIVTSVAALLLLGTLSAFYVFDRQSVSTPALPAERDARPAKTSESEVLVPLPITLPKAQYVGTPTSIAGIARMERPRGKPRPPFLAPRGVANVALGKPVTASIEEPIMGEFSMLVDGDKEAMDGSLVELDPFPQSVTIDLEAEHEIYAILVWHYHKQARVYFDVIVQIADDADFVENVRTIFNNDDDNSSGLGAGADLHYVELNEGKLFDAEGQKARYVRLYSNGNNSDDQNHYLEVEVYARPAN